MNRPRVSASRADGWISVAAKELGWYALRLGHSREVAHEFSGSAEIVLWKSNSLNQLWLRLLRWHPGEESNLRPKV